MIRSTIHFHRRQFLQSAAVLAASGMVTNHLIAADENPTEPAETRSPWLLGCFTRPFSEFTYEQTVQAIASAGFAAVGLMSVRLSDATVTLADANDSQVEEIREQAAKHKLSIAATYYGGPPVDRSVTVGIEALRRLIDNCHQAKCATILMGGTTSEPLFDAYYDAVAACCDYAAQKQVALVLKPHGGLNATGPQCRQIVARVNHPAFRLWYDPGNIFYYSEGQLDPINDATSVDGLVTGMCVKDFLPPQDVAINPGTGRVDFPKLMTQLKAGGFVSGPLIVETLKPGDLETTKANAAAAYKFLSELVRQ
jgi:sugar phosphate isomerase/epimerase